jgi:hypothetical protein
MLIIKRYFDIKSLHLMEEACSMGFSGGFEQGKPETALPELRRFIPVNGKWVNPQNKFCCV